MDIYTAAIGGALLAVGVVVYLLVISIDDAIKSYRQKPDCFQGQRDERSSCATCAWYGQCNPIGRELGE